MSRRTKLKKAEHRVRSSKAYHAWKQRNLGPACINCDKTEHLEVHHIVSLYHILLGLWQLYGTIDVVARHAIAMHENDECDAVTLCKDCHAQVHPGKRIKNDETEIRIENWAVLPRKLPGPFIHHPTKSTEKGLTLIGVQTLAAMGWYILNGRMRSRIIECNTRSLAALLGKTPGTSWSRGLRRALQKLEELNVVAGWHIAVSDAEIHVSRDYLDLLWSPWFVSMKDVHTSKMPVFALRWVLGLHSNKKVFRIGPSKLARRMCLTTQKPSFVTQCVERCCQDIPWAKCEYDGKNITFYMQKRGAVPIWTLRDTLAESIAEGS